MNGAPIRVVAGVVVADGRVLVARRAPSATRGGLWELPGGKVEPQESDACALIRELREELNITVGVGPCLGEVLWAYSDLTIQLVVYVCGDLDGIPVAREHDEVAFVGAAELPALEWSPADRQLLPTLVKYLRSESVEFR